ncbi:MAG: barstar family protein [Allomuricauda sp.]
MTPYYLSANKLMTWKSFHKEFKSTFNFPDYYGENMDAWIDCMDELFEKPIIINIKNAKKLRENAPDIFAAILECAAFVNYRKVQEGGNPTILVAAN